MKIKDYELPDDLYYHGEHAWARLEKDGRVRVGMNDFFQKAAGGIVYVDLPFEDDEVSQGETCGKVQSSKWVGKLVSPVSGKIVEVNSNLEDQSGLINKDPYGTGWIMLVQPSAWNGEKANLICGAGPVAKWMEGEMKKAESGGKK
ncbi:MAG: glycine cleavage system protein H [Candidatus Eisenbacteria bacterium]|nr:glycine cleavage system protein H [Candidatus Eisenbacteria bacterium]